MQAFKIYIIVRLTSHPHHSLGPVAHLVERLICTEEAGSSNLLWSTYDSRQHASVAGFVVVRPEKIRKTVLGTLWVRKRTHGAFARPCLIFLECMKEISTRCTAPVRRTSRGRANELFYERSEIKWP